MYNFTKKWYTKSKTIKRFLLCGLVLFFFGLSTQSFYAQDVGSSSVQANFGIDGDVYSGVLEFPNLDNPVIPLPAAGGVDDWFMGPTGLGVIDELGSANGGNPTSDPDPPNSTDNEFIELRQSVWAPTFPFPYPIVNGDLWIDSVYGRDTYVDGGSAETSYFSSGADKNSDNPINWSIGTMGSVPQKTDIVDAYAHLRGDGPKAPTMLDPRPFATLYAYAGASLVVTNGNKHLDFEFFRKGLTSAADFSDVTKLGPNGGRTAWTFDPDGPDDSPGGNDDGSIVIPGTIIVSVDYINGGTVPDVRIRVWMSLDTYNAFDNTWDGRPFNVDKNVAFEQGTDSGVYGYAAINPVDENTTVVWGRVNDNMVDDVGSTTFGPPWGTWEGVKPDFVTEYERYQFVEIGINLTAFGLDRRGTDEPCSNILGSLLVKTRSSGGGPNEGAFGSELKDFVGPFLFGFAGEEPDITVTNKAICADANPVNITTGNSVTGGGAIEYYFDDEYTDSVPDPTAYNAPLGETTIYVRSEKIGFPGCYGFNSFIVTVNDKPTAVCTGGDLDCNTPNGEIDLLVTTNATNKTYSWSTLDGTIESGAATATPTVSSGGTYTVVVTNTDNGCTNTCDAIVTENFDKPTAVCTGGEIDCNTPNGEIDLLVTTNAPNKTYSWSTLDGTIESGAATATPTVSSGGTYTVVVTNTDNGCTNTCDAIVTEDLDKPTAVCTGGEIDCNTPDGEIDLLVTTNATNKTYSWSTLDGTIESGAATATPTVSSGGTYTVVVTNTDNGCTNTCDAIVTEDLDKPTAVCTGGDLDCNTPNGEIDLLVTTNATNKTYSWSTLDGTIESGAATATPTVSSGGTYTVVVTNTDNGCTNTCDAIVTENFDKPTAVCTGGEIDCNTPNGEIDLLVTTNAPNKTYSWSTLDGTIESGAATATPTVSSGGTYTVVVTNTDNGCTNTCDAIVTEDLDKPTAVCTGGEIDCNTPDGEIDLLVTTNATNKTYSWSTLNGTIESGANTATPTVSSGGTYTVVVTNTDNGCTNTCDAIVTEDLDKPTAVCTGGEIDCNTPDGEIDLLVTTNATNKTYSWSTLNGTIESGANTATPTVSSGGTYTVVVTNTDNGCTNTCDAIVTEDLDKPTAVCTGGEIDCNTPDGEIDLLVTTNATNKTYSWSTLNGTIESGANTATPTVSSGGTYTVVVTNTDNGCTNTCDAIVTEDLDKPTAVCTGGEIDCNTPDGEIDLLVTTNATNKTYSWSTLNGTIESGANTATPTVSSGGTYIVVVTNTDNGCTNTCDAIVTEDLVPPSCSITGGQEICPGETTSFTAVTNYGNVSYSWTGPGGFTANTVSTGNISAIGTYEVTITNNDNGCYSVCSRDVIPIGTTASPVIEPDTYCEGDEPPSLCGIATVPEGVDGEIVWLGVSKDGGELMDVVLDGEDCPVAPTDPGVYAYLVEIDTKDGCVTTFGSLALFTVNPLPPCSIEAQEWICPGGDLDLVFNGDGSNIKSYLWSTNGGANIVGADTASATAQGAVDDEIFTLTVTSNDDCVSTCTITADVRPCVENCGTAYAKLDTDIDFDDHAKGDGAICFEDAGGFKRWGWTNKINCEGEYLNNPLYRGAGQCDTSKGDLVGNVDIIYQNGSVTINFNIDSDKVMSEAHIYVGCDPFPKKKKGGYYTVAPGQYPFNPSLNCDGGDTYVQNYSVTINADDLDADFTGGIFVIVHTVVCDIRCNGDDGICTQEQLDEILSEGCDDETTAFTTNNVDCYNDNYDYDKDGIMDVCDECPKDASNTCNLAAKSVADFTAYPVPFKDKVSIKYFFEYDTNVKIEVFDIKGALIQKAVDNNYAKGTSGTTTLDMSRADNQLYFVRLKTNRGELVKKIISFSPRQ